MIGDLGKIKSVGTINVSTKTMPLLIETECDNFFGLHFKGIVFCSINLSKISGVKNISFEIFVHHWLVESEEAEARKYFNNIQ